VVAGDDAEDFGSDEERRDGSIAGRSSDKAYLIDFEF